MGPRCRTSPARRTPAIGPRASWVPASRSPPSAASSSTPTVTASQGSGSSCTTRCRTRLRDRWCCDTPSPRASTTTALDGFYFIYKQGAVQTDAAPTNLPSGIRYAEAICGLSTVDPAYWPARLIQHKLSNKEFIQEDFYVSQPAGIKVLAQPLSGRINKLLTPIQISVRDAFGDIVTVDNSTMISDQRRPRRPDRDRESDRRERRRELQRSEVHRHRLLRPDVLERLGPGDDALHQHHELTRGFISPQIERPPGDRGSFLVYRDRLPDPAAPPGEQQSPGDHDDQHPDPDQEWAARCDRVAVGSRFGADDRAGRHGLRRWIGSGTVPASGRAPGFGSSVGACRAGASAAAARSARASPPRP